MKSRELPSPDQHKRELGDGDTIVVKGKGAQVVWEVIRQTHNKFARDLNGGQRPMIDARLYVQDVFQLLTVIGIYEEEIRKLKKGKIGMRPLHTYIIIDPEVESSVLKLQDADFQVGKVVAIGPGRQELIPGSVVPCGRFPIDDIKVGDLVAFRDLITLEHEGKKIYLTKYEEVALVL